MKMCPKCNTFLDEDDVQCIKCGCTRFDIEKPSVHPNIVHLNKEINVCKCPTCSSTNIQKISASNKVGSAVFFGLFSVGHISKTFKCDNCGMKF